MRYKTPKLLGLLLLTFSLNANAVTYNPETNYMLRCLGCHGQDGTGSERGGIPNFQDYVASFSTTSMGRQYLMHVPGVISSSLTDSEIAEVMNYIMRHWGGESLPENFKPFDTAEVSQLRKTEIKDVVAYRRLVVDEIEKAGLPVAPYPWP